MTRVGVTGHRTLDDDDAWSWVASALTTELSRLPAPLVGISALAEGADQMFARLVLELRGAIEAIVPFPNYRETLGSDAAREGFDRLLSRASRARFLPRQPSPEDAYLKAGKEIVHDSERVFAVWDRRPARGIGGTGEIVEYALSLRRPVTIVNPIRRSVEHCGEGPRV